jgi:hypothetical protein
VNSTEMLTFSAIFIALSASMEGLCSWSSKGRRCLLSGETNLKRLGLHMDGLHFLTIRSSS